jgi:hypothetical protein
VEEELIRLVQGYPPNSHVKIAHMTMSSNWKGSSKRQTRSQKPASPQGQHVASLPQLHHIPGLLPIPDYLQQPCRPFIQRPALLRQVGVAIMGGVNNITALFDPLNRRASNGEFSDAFVSRKNYAKVLCGLVSERGDEWESVPPLVA